MQRDMVFLFGAGASFGSEKECYGTPPLGAHLFEELDARKGAFSKLTDDQKSIFRTGDFEAGMATVYDSNHAINPLQNEIACYLSGFNPSKENAYKKLLESIPDLNKVSICTLNYDLLIERCLEDCGYTYDYKKSSKAIPLLKIHGSSNFLPMLKDSGLKLEGATFEQCGTFIEGIKTKSVKSQHEIIAWTQDPANKSVSPVLAMYNKEKRTVINSKLIKNIAKQFKNEANRARVLVICGVRFMGHDTHIWHVISSAKGKVILVDPQPNEAYDWLHSHGKKNVEIIESGFYEATDKIIERVKFFSTSR